MRQRTWFGWLARTFGIGIDRKTDTRFGTDVTTWARILVFTTLYSTHTIYTDGSKRTRIGFFIAQAREASTRLILALLIFKTIAIDAFNGVVASCSTRLATDPEDTFVSGRASFHSTGALGASYGQAMSFEAYEVTRTFLIGITILTARAKYAMVTFRAFFAFSTRAIGSSSWFASSVDTDETKRAVTAGSTILDADLIRTTNESSWALLILNTQRQADAIDASVTFWARILIVTQEHWDAFTIKARIARRTSGVIGAYKEADIAAVSWCADVSIRTGFVDGRITFLDACTIEAGVTIGTGVLRIATK